MNHPSAPAAHDLASAPPALPKTIWLTGFMGAGKSAIGRALAHSLGYDFIDLDDEVEARAGKSIAAIFAEEGELGFRARERKHLGEAMDRPGNKVIALGGGTFIGPEALALAKSHDVFTIFLEAPAEELHRRCVDSLGAALRPLLQDLPSFKKLYAERLPFYQRADLHVNTSGEQVSAVAASIMGRLREAGSTPQRMRS